MWRRREAASRLSAPRCDVCGLTNAITESTQRPLARCARLKAISIKSSTRETHELSVRVLWHLFCFLNVILFAIIDDDGVLHSWDIQLYSVYFIFTQYHKLQTPLRGLYSPYTYDLPDLWPHLGSGTTLKNIEKKPSGCKKWRTLQESNRGGTLSRMNTWIEVMWPFPPHYCIQMCEKKSCRSHFVCFCFVGPPTTRGRSANVI